jgi:hypothetical protein
LWNTFVIVYSRYQQCSLLNVTPKINKDVSWPTSQTASHGSFDSWGSKFSDQGVDGRGSITDGEINYSFRHHLYIIFEPSHPSNEGVPLAFYPGVKRKTSFCTDCTWSSVPL